MELTKKLREALKEMRNPLRDQTAEIPTKSGSKYKYNYATLDQVLDIVKTALEAHDVSLLQRVERLADGYMLMTYVFDDDEKMELDVRPYHVTADTQAQGSFETYMRRYSLMMAFGLAGEDDDGSKATERARANESRPDYLQPIRDLIGEFSRSLGLSSADAVERITSAMQVKEMRDIPPADVQVAVSYMLGEIEAAQQDGGEES